MKVENTAKYYLRCFHIFSKTDIPCGDTVTELPGLIMSPDLNQDGLYDNFMYCKWTIESFDGLLVEFDIPFIRLYPREECYKLNNDELKVSIVFLGK